MTKITYRSDPNDPLVPQSGRGVRSEVVRENFQVLNNASAGWAFDTERIVGENTGEQVTSVFVGPDSTATVVLEDHGFSVADEVVVSGANEADYNGTFSVVSVPDSDTFTYTISGADPDSPATGTISVRWKNRVGTSAGSVQISSTSNLVITEQVSPELDTTVDGTATPGLVGQELIALLTLSSGGVFAWSKGAWVTPPTIPTSPVFPGGLLPIAKVLVTYNQDEIVEDTITDVRPVVGSASAGGSGNFWSDPVDADIIPDATNTRDLGALGTRFKDGYFAGKLYVAGGIDPIYLQLDLTTPASVPANALFLEDVAGTPTLRYKDGGGAVTSVTEATSISSYDTTSATVGNGSTDSQDITATSGSDIQRGFISKVTLNDDSTLGSGQVLVEIYNDAGRTEKVFSRVYDLANTPLVDVIPAFFESDNSPSTGTMHIDVTNSTGTSTDLSVSVSVASVLPFAVPPAGSGGVAGPSDAGDGILYNAVDTRFDLDLFSTNPGLELVGASGSGQLRVLVGDGLQRTASGVEVDSTVVRTTGDQTYTGHRRFTNTDGTNGFGLIPAAVSGPPTSGTWVAGDFFLDTNLIMYQCVSGGSPGTWKFWGWHFEQGVDVGISAGADNATYTDVVSAGGSVVVPVSTGISTAADTNRRGVIRRLLVWGAEATVNGDPDTIVTGDVDQGFRVSCYPNENVLGRDQLWMLQGQLRKTDIDGAVTGGVDNTIPVTNSDIADQDILVRLRSFGDTAEEYGRITVRRATPVEYDLDEAVLNDFASNDPFMVVTETIELGWFNNSSIPANRDKIYLEFHNPGPADVIFGYQLDLENIGGGSF